MKLEIIEANKSISSEEVLKIEEKYNFNFPETYRTFLINYNGGKTNKLSLFNDYDELGPLSISKFFSLEEIEEFIIEIQKQIYSYELYISQIKDDEKEEKKEEIEIYQSELRYYLFGINHMIIIADSYNYVKICICHKGKNIGKIYWTDETHEDEFYLLTDNFETFLNSFETEDF